MIKLTIEIDDVATAAKIAKLIAQMDDPLPTIPYPHAEPTMPPYTAPEAPWPANQPIINPAVQPPAPAPVAAPVAAAPAFTVEQVAKAGAALLTAKPDLMAQLQALLTKYGAGSVKELPADQLGAFAAELRKMGAKI